MSAQPSRHELESRLMSKLWSDDEFRKAFEENPRAMVAKALGISEDQAPKIVPHQEAAGEWHIAVPHHPAAISELSDDDLEQLAGGTSPFAVVYDTIGAVTLAGAATAQFADWGSDL